MNLSPILKSLIVNSTEKKWHVYFSKFHNFFKDRDPQFDMAISFISDYTSQFEVIPDYGVFETELTATQEFKFLEYVKEVVNNPAVVSYDEDKDFISFLSSSVKAVHMMDCTNAITESQNSLSTLEKKDIESVNALLDGLSYKMHTLKAKVNNEGSNSASLMYGDEILQALIDEYEVAEFNTKSGECRYFDMMFDAFQEISVKKGDLVFFSGYTSHGKSILLRNYSYHLMVEYGLNVCFFTFEMGHNEVRQAFAVHHANNKKIFPNTPRINWSNVINGTLEQEEKTFFYEVALPDFLNNDSYGNLFIDQPHSSTYTLNDLESRLKEVESTIMPIDVVALDYLTLMTPAGNPNYKSTESVNDMIKEFKNMALTNTHQGNLSPYIALTACQVSRRGLDECVKNQGVYDLTSAYMYTEIEKSADVFMSVLMTPEMKKAGTIRLQNLKNRNGGVVVDPIDFQVNLAEGWTISEVVSTPTENLQGDLTEVFR